MIGVVQAFAPHDARARVLFLEAAATAGLTSESHVSPQTGIAGKRAIRPAKRLMNVSSGPNRTEGRSTVAAGNAASTAASPAALARA